MQKSYAKMEESPITSIKPHGWLRRYLELQKTGLTGHLEAAGFPFNEISWNNFSDLDAETGWAKYEQTGYWADGMERCAELLGSRSLRDRVGESIDYVLDNADEDGYLGPKFMKKSDGWNRWPHVVFFRAIMAKYSATGDERYINALVKHYLGSQCDFSNARDVLNIEQLVWLYRITGEKKLIDLAEKTWADYNAKTNDDNTMRAYLSPKRAYAHGVTYNEIAKLGAILYSATGKREYLRPTLNAYKKIDRYQMLVDGVMCSNEFMLDNDYMMTHETCDIVDYSWAIGYVYMATGDGSWGDKIERATFNAGIGSVDEKFRALQYFSCANQVILDDNSNHNDFFKGGKWMSYRPNPGTECCPGNVNRFFPNYCARMWMKKGYTNVFAALYGASEYRFGTGDGRVTITEETDYPFEDTVRFTFSAKKPRKLCFHIRIPGWCENPSVKVNGETVEIKNVKGFTVIERVFSDGDKVEACFPSTARICDYHGQGLYVEKGPLVYTYGMWGERHVDKDEVRSTPDFPAYNIYPDKRWNFALCEDSELTVEKNAPMSNEPWDVRHVPLTIKVSAREVMGWTLKHVNKIKYVENLYTVPWVMLKKDCECTFTPRHPTKKFIEEHGLGEVEELTLVPYGAAKCRMTIFPKTEKAKKA